MPRSARHEKGWETMGVTVERTDFISVPVTDLERSRRFYGETLGLAEIPGQGSWPEFQLGENVSLYLLDPTNIGQTFEGPHTAPIALRVPDVHEAQTGRSRPRASSSRASRSTRASATWRSSTTLTATR